MSNGQKEVSWITVLFGKPRTRLGRWSTGLAVGFFALFALWLFYVQARPIARPTFFSDPLHVVLILGAVAAAITGGMVGALALGSQRERSLWVMLSGLLGAFVLYWTIGELTGH